MNGTHDGKVVWFNKERGYGLIASEGYPAIFVHQTSFGAGACVSLFPDQKVQFDLYEHPKKGFYARNVSRG